MLMQHKMMIITRPSVLWHVVMQYMQYVLFAKILLNNWLSASLSKSAMAGKVSSQYRNLWYSKKTNNLCKCWTCKKLTTISS